MAEWKLSSNKGLLKTEITPERDVQEQLFQISVHSLIHINIESVFQGPTCVGHTCVRTQNTFVYPVPRTHIKSEQDLTLQQTEKRPCWCRIFFLFIFNF